MAVIDAVLIGQLAWASRYHKRHQGKPIFKHDRPPPYLGSDND